MWQATAGRTDSRRIREARSSLWRPGPVGGYSGATSSGALPVDADRAGADRTIDATSVTGDPPATGDGGSRDQPTSRRRAHCGPSASSCRRGRSATPAPGSRSSPSRASRATRTRRSPTPPRSTATPASRRPSRCTSRGTRSTTTRISPAMPPTSASRSGPSTRTRSRTTTTCSAASATPTRACGGRPSTISSTASTSWTRPGRATSSCGSPTAPTTPARTTSAPARTASPRRSPSSMPGSAPDQRMVLEYKLFEPSFYTTDVPDWGTAYVHCLALGPEGAGRRRHRPPRAGHQHRVHRRLAAARGQARRLRLQLALLRRRRPDGRLRRPVPALPDHARGRPGGRPRPESGVAFMLDQCHNIEPKIPGQIRSVMNVQEATAKALLVDRRRARGGPGSPATCSARTPC